jgi:lysophospholipase L1-like esterase
MKIKKLLLLAGIFLILGGRSAEAGNFLYFPLMFKDHCTNFTFLAFGDSITAGYGSSISPFDPINTCLPYCGYVAQLYDGLHKLYPQQDISFYNMGIGGQTTDQGMYRIEANITQPVDSCYYGRYPKEPGCLYPQNHEALLPELVLIMMGTNDLNISNRFEMIDFDLRSMVSTALLYSRVIIATIPPVSTSLVTAAGDSFFSQVMNFNPRIRQIALDYQIPLVDVFEYFLSNRDWESQLMYDDEHPNDAGYAVIKQAFLDQINPRMTAEGCYLAPR